MNTRESWLSPADRRAAQNLRENTARFVRLLLTAQVCTFNGHECKRHNRERCLDCALHDANGIELSFRRSA